MEPGVQWVLAKTRDDFTAKDVYWYLRENKASLFLVFVDREYAGFFTVEIATHPVTGARTLNIWLMHLPGAEELQDELVPCIKRLALDAKCSGVEMKTPRKGFQRHMPAHGFAVKLVTWRFDL